MVKYPSMQPASCILSSRLLQDMVMLFVTRALPTLVETRRESESGLLANPVAEHMRWMPQVVDSAVLRFPKAVTHFSAGSYSSRPLQTTSIPNVFMAGDWVKGVPHGANGLSQVRIS